MSSAFRYEGTSLRCDGVDLSALAEEEGTPCYVYSQSSLLSRYREYDGAFGDLPHQVCYAVKANANLTILRLLAQAGAGFDIVSGGELYRVLQAGGDPGKVVFSGVGKTASEIEYALAEGIGAFNCESEAEMELLDSLAARQSFKPVVAIRVNPDVNAETHPYISTGLREHKFGIDIVDVESVYETGKALKHLRLEAVSCHIGSQLLELNPLLEAIDKMLALVSRLRNKGLPIRILDFGGGLGVSYQAGEQPPAIEDWIGLVCERVRGQDLELTIEPGRSIVGEAGVLLTRVLYRKRNGSKEFVITDAGMNDLIRPTLYGSYHEIVPVRRNATAKICADVVGPVCESGDYFAKDRTMPDVSPGDLLAICTAGAYGFAQASNYNSRPRAAEVLVHDGTWSVIRRRESFEDLVRGESPVPVPLEKSPQ